MTMSPTAGSVYERVVSVISKAPSDRGDSEAEELISWFRARCKLFETVHSDVVKDIIKCCDFVEAPINSVIIRQGEIGDCFYILLTGKVSVYINSNLSEIDQGDDDKEKEDDDKPVENAPSSEGRGNFSLASDRTKFGNCVVQLGQGKGFGELALINKDCIRNASIIVDECADLVVVGRVLYNRSLKKPQEEEFQERNRFANDFPYFANWHVRHKKQLAYSLSRTRFPFGTHIVKQGEPTNGLFFLIKGEAKLVVNRWDHQTQFPEFYPLPDPQMHDKDQVMEEFLRSLREERASFTSMPFHGKKGDSIGMRDNKDSKVYTKPKQQPQQPPTTPISRSRANTAPPQRRGKHVDLCLIRPVEVIGELEMVLGDTLLYVQTVVCTESAEVFHLNNKNYERLVVRRYPRVVNLMRESAYVRLQSRLTRFPFDHIPLLTFFQNKFRSIESANFRQKTRKQREEQTNTYDLVAPKFGAIVDLHGPGTVFYRIRQREYLRQQRVAKEKHRRGNTDDPSTHKHLESQQQAIAEADQDVRKTLEATRRQLTEYSNREATITFGEGFGFDDYDSISPYNESANEHRPYDKETSDEALKGLEDKLKSWYSSICKPYDQGRITTLRRYKVEEMSQEPKPGRRVLMKRKPLLTDELEPITTNDQLIEQM